MIIIKSWYWVRFGVWHYHKKIARDIKGLKLKHNLKPDFEIKWTKVSASKVEFYLEVVDYFFSNPALRFRGVVVPDKEQLTMLDSIKIIILSIIRCFFMS